MTCENRTEASQRALSRTVPSLSVTLAIGITSWPTFDPAQLDMLQPTRDMRHVRMKGRGTNGMRYMISGFESPE